METSLPDQRRTALDFRLLGPFEITTPCGSRTLGGRAEQSLSALLLLHPGQVLSSEQLIDLLWEDTTGPADPANALQNRVSKLRRALRALGDAAPRLVTTSGGYRLDLAPEAIDVHRFVEGVESARRSIRHAPEEAEQTYLAALAQWRGAALSGLQREPWAETQIHRLEDLRLAASEERLNLALGLGRQREVVQAVSHLVEEHPLHEGLTHLQMRALYLTGRQAEALEAFQRLRSCLDDQLGLEPSVHLRDLEERILRQDPALGVPEAMHVDLAGSAATRHPAPANASGGEPSPGTTGSPAVVPTPRLPLRVSSFVGRDEETSRVIDLVSCHRLVTIAGSGGAGKTSLAIEASHRLADQFDDGVRLVELSRLADSSDVLHVVADALGVTMDPDPAAPAPQEQLLQWLEAKDLLLVIDNCEHVIEVCADFVELLLTRSPSIRLLTTSREALNVRGEAVFRLPPLKLPPLDATPHTIAGYPTVRLFLDRMIAANPLVSPLGPEELQAVAAICRMLDGLPLAIELAAARTAALSVSDIAGRLQDVQRFRLLTMGPRTAEARHKTLRATVDWSYSLLPEAERSLLRRLSVFRGGWTLDAAEMVGVGDDISPEEVVHLLGQLVNRSLVVPKPGLQARFHLLETVRAFAHERLVAAGDHTDTYARLSRWALMLAEESEQHLRGPQQRRCLQQLQDELDNIRTALSWAAEEDPDLAGRIAGSLGWFFHLGRPVEGKEILDRIAGGSPRSDETTARLLQARSIVNRPRVTIVHPSPRCAAAAAESLALFERIGDRHRAALSRALLAVEGAGAMPRTEALGHLDLADREFTETHDPWGHALTSLVRQAIETKAGDLAAAQRWGQVAADRFRAVGDAASLSAVLFQAGVSLRQSGQHREAIEAFRQAADEARQLNLHSIVQWSLSGAGVSALGLDDFDEAERLFDAAVTTRSELGDPAVGAHAGHGAGLVARARGDYCSARRHFHAACEGYRRVGTPLSTAAALSGIAWSAAHVHDLGTARQAVSEVLSIAEETTDDLIRAWGLEVQALVLAVEGRYPETLSVLDRAAELRVTGNLPGLPFEEREVRTIRESVTRAAMPASEPHAAGRALGSAGTVAQQARQ